MGRVRGKGGSGEDGGGDSHYCQIVIMITCTYVRLRKQNSPKLSISLSLHKQCEHLFAFNILICTLAGEMPEVVLDILTGHQN